MIIDMRTWARTGSPVPMPHPTAPLSALQSSINSLHLANTERKARAEQPVAQEGEPDFDESPAPDSQDGDEAADEAEDGSTTGDTDDQGGAGDPLNR